MGSLAVPLVGVMAENYFNYRIDEDNILDPRSSPSPSATCLLRPCHDFCEAPAGPPAGWGLPSRLPGCLAGGGACACARARGACGLAAGCWLLARCCLLL
jgi:hypothetical protein